MTAYRLGRRFLFRLEPERAHALVLAGLGVASRSRVALASLERAYAVHDERLAVRAFGLEFRNPLGLAAGLDKDAVAIPALLATGFGFVEVGSVTARAQPGNPRPRLFRLVEDEALVNRMGFNNLGAEAMAARLTAWRARGERSGAIVGVNVGRSRAAGEDAGATLDDYEASLRTLWGLADYLALNVSSPNTPGLRDLQRPQRLAELLGLVAGLNEELGRWPVLLKIAPDLDDAELADIVAAATSAGTSGIIATNTTAAREGLLSPAAGESGGLSGRPLARRSLAVLERLRALTDLPLVSVGGIFTAADALERLVAGADLIQIYTSFVYRGPGVVGQVLRGVVAELDRRGLQSVSELRGAA